MSASTQTAFGQLLRYWRGTRKRSQLAVASDAGVSTRHLSFLETGRSTPSRDMVLRLSDVLEVPLRERNALLEAAGFAAAFRETPLSDDRMTPVRRSVQFLLEAHDPYPAVLVDAHWRLLEQNNASMRVLSRFIDPSAVAPPLNVMRLLFDPRGMRPYIVNWHQVAASMIHRLQRETASSPGDDPSRRLLAEMLAAPGVPDDWRQPLLARESEVLIPLHLRRDELELTLFSAITTLGTPRDITLQELRLETFFPADDATETALRTLSSAS